MPQCSAVTAGEKRVGRHYTPFGAGNWRNPAEIRQMQPRKKSVLCPSSGSRAKSIRLRRSKSGVESVLQVALPLPAVPQRMLHLRRIASVSLCPQWLRTVRNQLVSPQIFPTSNNCCPIIACKFSREGVRFSQQPLKSAVHQLIEILCQNSNSSARVAASKLSATRGMRLANQLSGLPAADPGSSDAVIIKRCAGCPNGKRSRTREKEITVARRNISGFAPCRHIRRILSVLGNPFRPVACWHAEGDAQDSTGNNNGILVGNAAFSRGMVGKAFKFGGDGSYVKIPKFQTLNPVKNITIEFWMKADPANALHHTRACRQ